MAELVVSTAWNWVDVFLLACMGLAALAFFCSMSWYLFKRLLDFLRYHDFFNKL